MSGLDYGLRGDAGLRFQESSRARRDRYDSVVYPFRVYCNAYSFIIVYYSILSKIMATLSKMIQQEEG